MNKPIIVIKKRAEDYQGLVSLGNKVHASITANAVNFTTPSPTLAALQTGITDVENAIQQWGTPGHRGSHADLLDLKQKSRQLLALLQAMAAYVTNVCVLAAGSDYLAMTALMYSSGFDLKMVPTPQGVLEMVQNFRRTASPLVNHNAVLLEWVIPANARSIGNVETYKVFRSLTEDFSTAIQIAAVGKTSFIDTNFSPMPVTYTYWIIPVSAAGDGIRSEGVTVTLGGLH